MDFDMSKKTITSSAITIVAIHMQSVVIGFIFHSKHSENN